MDFLFLSLSDKALPVRYLLVLLHMLVCYQLDDETILCEDCLEGYIKERFFMILQ